jgi:hypothetical protein
MSRESRLATRRDKKFKDHHVEIREERVTEPRVVKGKEELVEFSHAVYVRRKLEARTHSRRSALKKGHQYIRNTR